LRPWHHAKVAKEENDNVKENCMEEEDGETLGITKNDPFEAEGKYGPAHDWTADPE